MIERYGTFGLFLFGDRLTLFFKHGSVEHLYIKVVSDSLHMSALLCSEDISRSTYLEVTQGYPKACSKFRILSYRLKPLCRNIGKCLILGIRKIGISSA